MENNVSGQRPEQESQETQEILLVILQQIIVKVSDTSYAWFLLV